MSKRNKERRVVVTGLGPLSAIGFGKDALWDSIINQKTGLKKETYSLNGEIWDSFWLHKINSFDINKFNIDKQNLEEIRNWKRGKEDKDCLYLLAAIKLALDDALIQYDKENNNVGLFLTVEHPGFDLFCVDLVKEAISYLSNKSSNDKNFSKAKMFKYLFDKLADDGYVLQTFIYLYLISKAFGIHGYSLFTSNACASGLFAFEAAVRQIKYGNSSVAIVAGGDNPCTMFKHLWFKERKLYAEDGKIKPFSKKADGLVFGDGASAIVFEELEHAKNRGANIYAEYLGAGFSLEGWKIVFPQIGSNSYQKVMKEALERAKIKADDIDLINPHGVGIKVTDLYESKAINEVFNGNKRRPFVTAFKPYVGHNLGGSALLETIILLIAMQNGLIPPTLNCQEYDSKNNINLVRKAIQFPLNTVMKLSCGFAGYNGAVIFKKYA